MLNRNTRRAAVMPRRSAMTTGPSAGSTMYESAQPTPLPGSTFMGFQEIEETADENDWFEQTQEHEVVAGAYHNVKIYMTGKGFQQVHKWSYTDMVGNLRLVKVHDAEGYPVLMLQLKGVDAALIERDTVFEFELPFNFKIEADLSRTFSAIECIQGEYVGFLFESPEDKDSFQAQLEVFHQTL